MVDTGDRPGYFARKKVDKIQYLAYFVMSAVLAILMFVAFDSDAFGVVFGVLSILLLIPNGVLVFDYYHQGKPAKGP